MFSLPYLHKSVIGEIGFYLIIIIRHFFDSLKFVSDFFVNRLQKLSIVLQILDFIV